MFSVRYGVAGGSCSHGRLWSRYSDDSFRVPVLEKWGLEGVAEWQMNSVIVSKTVRRSRRTAEAPISWIIGGHLFHGTVAGVAFGLFLSFIALLATSILTLLLAALP